MCVLIQCVCACVCVHSAGVGRTGVFITLSIVLERMRYEGVVDLFQTVKTLRTQRPAMVQTEVRTCAGAARHRPPPPPLGQRTQNISAA